MPLLMPHCDTIDAVGAHCGDEEPPAAGSACTEDIRLSAHGTVGPTEVLLVIADPPDGPIGDTFFDVIVEEGATPHLVVFTTNTALDTDLRTALRARLDSGADNAGTLVISSRPPDLPCDPREGSLCAAYGVDTNGDGILLGTSEVIYPALEGTATFSAVTGNEISATFDITFGPIEEGDEEGGDAGGNVAGCFQYFLTADRSGLF
jgi:hypothetical protein